VKKFLLFMLLLGVFFISVAWAGEVRHRTFASATAHYAKLSAQLHTAEEGEQHLEHRENKLQAKLEQTKQKLEHIEHPR
jgi:hypothetical protein